jgi:hypothetical protein
MVLTIHEQNHEVGLLGSIGKRASQHAAEGKAAQHHVTA